MSTTPERIYLDNAATTPVRPEVLQEMMPFFSEIFGNPSSVHFYGRKSKAALEEARERVANAIGAKKEEIIFTSGGTESDNLAIKGVAYAKQNKGNHIITSTVEHHAVLETCHFLEKNGFNITYLPVDATGLVNPEDVRNAITDQTILISVMHGNNEIGTIEPIAEIGAIAKEKGITFHVDAVQTVGNIPVNVDELNCDLLAISAHKLYGPKGIGALYVRKGTRLVSLLHGGEQERRRRAGTENLTAIVGLGKAIELAVAEMPAKAEHITRLRDKLIRGIMGAVPYTRLNGHPEKRLPGNVNIAYQYIEGESVLLNLDMVGVAASSGSACSSASLEPSHVLTAIGLPHEIAHGAIRFSLGRETTEAQIDRLLELLPAIITKLRAMSPLYEDILKAKA